ncbi:MAG: ABC transporter ATP-binding protein, partial [Janthinobacterium sp.]
MRSQRRQAGPISRILQPIRGRLIAAASLAGTGSMLTLVPLAGIARLAHIAMAPALAPDAVWPIIIASVACLFLGMALMSLGELAAH